MNPGFVQAGYVRCKSHDDWCRVFMNPHGQWKCKSCVMCDPQQWTIIKDDKEFPMEIYAHSEVPTATGRDWRFDRMRAAE